MELRSEVVERGRRGRQEAAKDREMLWWIGRFRFVTARELSIRFGVSEQRINARVRQLLAAGLLGEHRPHVSESRAVYLSAQGAAVLDVPRRKPPRPEAQRRHELELVRLVADLERDPERLGDSRGLDGARMPAGRTRRRAPLERRRDRERQASAALARPRARLR